MAYKEIGDLHHEEVCDYVGQFEKFMMDAHDNVNTMNLMRSDIRRLVEERDALKKELEFRNEVTRDQLPKIKAETRKQQEIIADEAIATFISLLPQEQRRGLAKKHEQAIKLAVDHIERRREARSRISYAKYGQSVPMPDGQPDMCPDEVRAMYQ